MGNCSNLDFVKVNAYAKFDQIPSICSQAIERKKMTIAKGHNSVVKVDLVKVNLYAIFLV